MEILDTSLQAYLDNHCDAEPEALQTINRETHLKVLKPNMLSGHYQGRVLSMLSKMMQPKRILEIGTYTGYATVCLAEGLTEDGIIDTIEVNREMEEMLNTHFALTNVEKKIKQHFGPAEQIIGGLYENNYDIVFIDADKKNNYLYFQLVFDKVRSGGLIIIDNVLWKGEVLHVNSNSRLHSSKKAIKMSEFNDKISNDARINKVLIPLRDGIYMVTLK